MSDSGVMYPIIIIPSYCPDKRLVTLVENIREKVHYPIVIVDDGSGINYKEIFKETSKFRDVFVIYSEKNSGKGLALKKGVKYASEKYKDNLGYITCDSDGQHTVKDIIKISNAMIENQDSLVLGVRSLYSKGTPIKSKLGNYFSSCLFYFLTGKKCIDTQTGLRGIPKKYENIFLEEKGDRYDFEMNFLVNMAKKRIDFTEIKIKTIYFNNNKGSHYRPIKDSIKIFKGIIKYTFSSMISFFIDILMFLILYNFIFKGANFSIFISTVISRIISGIVNFILNQRWVFNGERNKNEFIKYSILFCLQMILSGLSVSLLINLINNSALAKLIVDSGLFLISYFIQKNIIFLDKKGVL